MTTYVTITCATFHRNHSTIRRDIASRGIGVNGRTTHGRPAGRPKNISLSPPRLAVEAKIQTKGAKMRILFQNLRKFAFGTQSDSKFRGAPNQSFTYYPTTVLRRWRAPYYAIDPRIVCVDGDKSALISSSVADGSGVV